MSKFPFSSFALGTFLAASLFSPAAALEPIAEVASLPPEIAQAYQDATKSAIYVCPRDAIKKADEDFLKHIEEMKKRFRGDFGATPDGEIVIPTVCPSPKSYPDFAARVKRYKSAVRHLGEVLRSN